MNVVSSPAAMAFIPCVCSAAGTSAGDATSTTKKKKRGPRQGKDMRLCVVTRERTSRSLMLRVVRRAPPAKPQVVLDERGIGRSAYISCTVAAVEAARRQRRLSHALRATVPERVFGELHDAAACSERLAESLSLADAFGRHAPCAPVDEVAAAHVDLAHDSVWV